MKENDWIVAQINNPQYTASDFRDLAGLTLDNTQFLSKQDYLKSDFIRNNDLFKDKDGNFKEEKFNQFYNIAAKNFIDFSSDDEINNYQYSVWDVSRPSDAPVKNESFTIKRVTNPEQVTVGIAGLQTITDPTRSKRSLAQDSKIYDPKTGKYLDKSVNDISLFSNPVEYIKSLWDEPLVYATYDEDTIEIDPVTGREIKHQKGEWKLNEYGRYYTEKLNGRNLLGKTVVSATDYITSENSALQKYDFFDSDDLEKSAIGSIVNNIVSLIPLATPVGTYYAGLIVARELAKSLPMLNGMITGFTSNELPNNKLVNIVAAYGQKFSGSTSDEAQESTFSSENLFNMIGDVVSQFSQQKFIARAYNKLVSGNKSILDAATTKATEEYIKTTQRYYKDMFSGKMLPAQFRQATGFDARNMKALNEMVESGAWQGTSLGKAAIDKYLPGITSTLQNRGKAGADLALAYMAIVSNTDVYESILEKGGTPFEAAAIALGSTIGMYSLDKYLGLGELFYEEDPARRALRQTVKDAVDSYTTKGVQNTTTKTLLDNMKQGIKLGQKAIENYRYRAKSRDLGILGKSIGEALEETGEELITDFNKQIGEVLGQLGYFSQTDYGAWDNAFDRYAMSFLGGAIGGGIYGVQYTIENRGKKALQFQNDITYFLRQGRKQELINEINKAFDKGYGGSKNIAWQTTEDGTVLTADNGRESESDHNRKQLLNIIEQLDLILNQNGLNLSEDELFDKMVQGDYRANALKDWLNKDDIASAKQVSYISRFQDDFNNITQAIINKQNEINELNKNTADGSRSTQEYKNKLDKLEAELQGLIDQKDYLFGEGSLGYVEKTLFAMDPLLAERFGFLNFNQFIRQVYGVDASQLTQSELENANKQWSEYQKKQAKSDVDTAFKIYKSMESSIAPGIEQLKTQNIQQYIDRINKLKEAFPFNKQLDLNDKLPDQTDEEYQAIFTKKEDEDDETYQNRIKQHQEAVIRYNNDNLYKWIQEYLNNSITTTDQRYITSAIPVIKSQIINEIVKGIQMDNLELQNTIRELVRTYENKDPEKLRSAIYSEIEKIINKQVDNNIEQAKITVQDQADFEALTSWFNAINDLSPEDKEAISIPIDYLFDDDNVITYQDFAVLYNYLLSQGQTEQQINDWFLNYGIDIQGTPYKLAYDNRQSDISLPTDELPAIVSDQFVINQRKEASDQLFKEIDEKLITPVLDHFNNDEIYQSLQKLVSASFVVNPALDIVNLVSKNSPNSSINLEQFLTDIYNTYNNGESAQDFQLSANQIDILNQFLQDLDVAQAYLYAASTDTGFSNPIGHNKAINNFINKHKDVFPNVQELSELDSNLANFLIQELNNYKTEIQSWINRHNINTQNRDAKLLKLEPAIAQTISDFFKINREAFKVNNIDLLEGFEGITLDNSLSSIVSIEELLYQNYNKFIKSGYTIDDFLDSIIPKITNIENISAQRTTKLDENINYSSLTDYDKFQLVISCIAASSRNYYLGLLNFLNSNDNIAPIASQEYVSKLVYSQQQNPELINRALDYISEKTGNSLQIAHNTSIVLGLGGTGKTFAVAGLNLGQGENIWISGPEQDQIDNLQNSLPKGKPITINELLNTIFGGSTPDLSTLYTISKSNGTSIIKLKEDIPIVTIQDKPNTIVIDESTHLNTPQIAIISEFCSKNGINLLLIGDDHQNGYNQDRLHNIENDQLLAWRTPSLSISLRSNNILKTANQNPLITIIDQLGEASADSFAAVTEKVYNDYVKNLEFIYNIDTSPNLVGELVTDQLTPEILSKIPKDANVKIGFIGEESSSTYQTLVRAGYNPIVKSPKQVQGREFDYIVIDQKWDLQINPNDWYDTGIKLFSFIQNLYTLISRSREGSIIINNGLSNIISNRQVGYSGTSSTIEQSVQRFRENRIPQIQKALDESNKFSTQQDTVRVQFNLFDGTVISGTQDIKEGTKKITFDDKPTVKPSDFNLTAKDIVGNRDQFNSDEEYNEAIEKANNDIIIDSVLVDPDNIVSIVVNGKTIKTSITFDNIFKPLPKPTVKKVNILGADVSQEDLQEEQDGIQSHSDDNNDEINDSVESDDKLSINLGSPIMVSSNISYSGIDTSQDTWTNEQNSTSDLGMFIRPGDRIEKGNKEKYVFSVLTMKDIFKFGTEYYDRLDPLVKQKFSKQSFIDAIENKQFYVQAVDIDNNNRLIGRTSGTGLSNDNRATYKDKIFKLVVKIVGNDGITYTLSLGGLNKPDTWEQNISIIQKGIQKRISESTEDTSSLKQYSDQLPDIINQYKATLDEILKNGGELQVEPPVLSKNTRIYKLKNSYRLENINDSKSPYEGVIPYQVMSEPYINLSDLPGISNKVKGKAVMFVSDNLLLSPSELKQIYINQLNDPHLPKQVRMLVLDNLGVSFKSLYTKKYTDLYRTQKGNTIFTVPFEATPMAVRMYISMWNFRAGLNRFLSSYETFKNENGYNDSQIGDLTREESELFTSMQRENPDLDEISFRNSLTDEQKQKFKPLWEFNDSLSSWCKEFKLGYNDLHGVYIRTFNNVNSEFYPNQNKVLGAYTDYKTASQYKASLDALFDNVINPIFPTKSPENTSQYITTKLSSLEGWFDSKNPKPLTLTFSDGNEEESISVKLNENNKLSSLPFILARVGDYMSQYSKYPDIFFEYDQEGNLPKKYNIKLDGINNGEPLNWRSAVEVFPNISEYNDEVPYERGKYIVPIDSENGMGIMDCRIDDMFSLMFHGLVSTRVPNDFTRKEIRATYARFKYGFFVDPLAVQRSNLQDSQLFDRTLTNKKFLGCDAAAGGGYMFIQLKPVTQTQETQNRQEVQVKPEIETQLETNLNNILSQVGKTIRRKKGKSIDDFFNLVQREISKQFISTFSMNKQITVDSFPNIIESIDRESDNSSNVIIHKLSDREEFRNKKLTNISNQKDYKVLTFDNGDIYNVYILNGQLKIDKQKSLENLAMSYNKDSVKNSIDNILNKEEFKSSVEEEIDADQIDQTINRYFNSNTTISESSCDRLINEIQTIINNSYIDDQIKVQITTELGQLKNKCAQ